MKPVLVDSKKKGKNQDFNFSQRLYKQRGLYFLYEKKKGDSNPPKLIYIGMSGSSLAKTIQRHFQKWRDNDQLQRISYKKKLKTHDYFYSVELMTGRVKSYIEQKECNAINKHQPRDNKEKGALPFSGISKTESCQDKQSQSDTDQERKLIEAMENGEIFSPDDDWPPTIIKGASLPNQNFRQENIS